MSRTISDFLEREKSLRGYSTHFEGTHPDEDKEAEAQAAATRFEDAFPENDMTAGGRLLEFNMARPGKKGYEPEWPKAKAKVTKGLIDGEERMMAKLPIGKENAQALMLGKPANNQAADDASDETATAPAASSQVTDERRKDNALERSKQTALVDGIDFEDPASDEDEVLTAPAKTTISRKRKAANPTTDNPPEPKRLKESASKAAPKPAVPKPAPKPKKDPAPKPAKDPFKPVEAYPANTSDDDILAGSPDRLYYAALYQVLKARTGKEVAKEMNKAHGSKVITPETIAARKVNMFKQIALKTSRAEAEVEAEFITAREKNGVDDRTGKGSHKPKTKKVQGG